MTKSKMLRVTNNDCTYTIRPGDTQADVCRSFGVSVAALRAANPGMDWRGGGRVAIPGHECLLPKGQRSRVSGVRSQGRGLQGMNELNPWSIPFQATNGGDQIKVQVNLGYGIVTSGNQVAAIRTYLTNNGFRILGLDGPGFGGLLNILLTRSNNSSLNAIASAVWNAVLSAGWTPTGISASIYQRAGELQGSGTIGGPIGTGTVVGGVGPIGGSSTPVFGALSTAAVIPGDMVEVQVQLRGGSVNYNSSQNAARIGNLLSGTYRVVGVDTQSVGGIFSSYVTVVVQATQPTRVDYVAADVNRAVSTVYSVSQTAGSISARFYGSRALAGTAVSPGVNPDFVTGGTRDAQNPLANNSLDDFAKAVGKAFGVPMTVGILAAVVGIVVLVVIKT